MVEELKHENAARKAKAKPPPKPKPLVKQKTEKKPHAGLHNKETIPDLKVQLTKRGPKPVLPKGDSPPKKPDPRPSEID